MAEKDRSTVVVPVVEEKAVPAKRTVARDGVRVRTIVHEHDATVEAEVTDEDVEIERVPAERWVERPEAIREEDGVTIVPLHEEVAVVQRRLRVVAELHIRKRVAHRTEQKTTTVRREEAVVEPLNHADDPST
jgi:stress response protein YsnF